MAKVKSTKVDLAQNDAVLTLKNAITSSQKVCVIGMGYIGLPTASLLAAKGFQVCGVDTNFAIIKLVNQKKNHICEKGLQKFVEIAIDTGNLEPSLYPTSADVFIVAVPTPFKAGKVPDLSYVEEAISNIVPYLQPGNLIVLESTSPVGTTEKVAKWIQEKRSDLTIPTYALRGDNGHPIPDGESRIYIAYCPERVLPGRIIEELEMNDRIVGGVDYPSAVKAKNFYTKFVKGEVLITDCRTAELCKLAENAYRDVNIAFANELSLVCDQLGLNVWEVCSLANRHPRVNILKPGPGVGGHCIAVDPWFIIDSAPEQTCLMQAARKVNDSMPNHVASRVIENVFRFNDPIIACLGLSYKADTNDLRESPSLEITTMLAARRKEKILVVEPNIEKLPDSLLEFNVELIDIKTALQNAHIILVLTDHSEFKDIDTSALRNKVIIDTRGMWQSKQ